MMGEPIHSGKELYENLDVLGMSGAELCRRIEVPVSSITEIIDGGAAVIGDTALRRPCLRDVGRVLVEPSTAP